MADIFSASRNGGSVKTERLMAERCLENTALTSFCHQLFCRDKSVPRLFQQIPERRLKSRRALDCPRNSRPIIFPNVSRPVGILQKLFLRAPIVAHGDERRSLVEVKIKPVFRIKDVRTHLNV